MSGPPAVTAENETPIYFPTGDDMLFGVYTRPAGVDRGVAVVTLSGGVHIPSANRNRLWVHLNRRLAASGFHCLRFDYDGVGESGGASEPFRRERPRHADLLGAVQWLSARGLNRFVLVGTCFGSLTAVTAAPDIAGLEGLVLLSPLILDSKTFAERAQREGIGRYVAKALSPRVIRGLLSADTRAGYARIARAKAQVIRDRSSSGPRETEPPLPASPQVVEAFARLASARIPVSVLFGSEDAHYSDWRRANLGRLGKVVAAAEDLEVTVLHGFLHGFPQLAVQNDVIDAVSDWIVRLAPVPAGE